MKNSKTVSSKEKLLFIYNANAGKGSALMDFAHKILSPKTYNCNLCDITFGVFTENRSWKKFREATSIEMEFMHKDEFAKTYASKFKHKFTFPIVLVETDNGFEVLLGTEELNALRKSEDLIEILEKSEVRSI